MTIGPTSAPTPSADEILSAIESLDKRTARDLAKIFEERATSSGTGNWSLLQQVFNFHFKPSNGSQPFGPMAMFDGKRSMIPDDLTAVDLDYLASTLDGVNDPEYQARIGDVLWLRQKDVRAARIAVAAYLEAGKRIEDPKSWPPSMDRYQRALRLARQFEPKGDLPKSILAHLESRVIYYDGTDPLFFSCKALELLAEFRFGDYQKLAAIAGKVAEGSRASGDYVRARSFFELQANNLKLLNEAAQAEEVRIVSARTFVEEAEFHESNNSFLVSHKIWGDAISAFRNRPSLRKEIPKLQRRYSIAGEKLRDEMVEISSGEEDISEFVSKSRAAVANRPWPDAFFIFVSIIPLIDPTELREASIKQMEEHPLQSIMPASMFDASGRKIGVRPSAQTDNKDQYEKAISGFIEENARIHRDITIQAHIAPMLRQLIEDHEIDKKLLESVLHDSQLIPADRREWFYEAFEAGFRWDFSTALHILIPQIENALRYTLEQQGVAPVNVDGEGVEEVWGLERLFAHPITTKIFGERFVFELNSLLVARLGPNLRNLFAHGVLPPDGFRSATAFYLWWLILRLAAYPTSEMRGYLERLKTPSA